MRVPAVLLQALRDQEDNPVQSTEVVWFFWTAPIVNL
jgi:hypothetical protein